MILFDEAQRKWNGPIPLDVRDQIFFDSRPEPGTRAAAREEWRHVRYWARKALRAKRAHDLLAKGECEYWLICALNTWAETRRAELAMRRVAE